VNIVTSCRSTESERPHRCCHLPNKVENTTARRIFPALGGNVTSVGWQVTLCDPMWHASSRSGVATLRTAIHLLLYFTVTLLYNGLGEMSAKTAPSPGEILAPPFVHPSPYRKALSDSFEIIGAI